MNDFDTERQDRSEVRLMTYKIYVETFKGDQLLFTNVLSYELKEGMVKFIDSKTNLERIYPSNKCQIEEVSQ